VFGLDLFVDKTLIERMHAICQTISAKITKYKQNKAISAHFSA